ncbi:MAG: SLC13 family permease [Arenicella sp.]
MDLNPHAIAVLTLTLFALILFTRERIPLESSSLLVVVLLAFGFSVFPFRDSSGFLVNPIDFFSGFGHEALIAVCGLMIAGHGIVRTGALEPIGRVLSKLWAFSPALSLLVTLVVGALLSAVVNNTPIVVLLLPILVSVSIRTKTNASSVLMPMGLATLLGGMTTTIGTSTNLLVVSVANDLGVARFDIFDFFIPASMVAAIGIIYLWLIAPRLLPNRTTAMPDTSPRVFTAHLSIPEDSFAEGKTLREVLKKAGNRMQVSKIRKSENNFTLPLPDATINAGDRLLVRDTPQNLKEFENLLGANLLSKGMQVDDSNPLNEEDQQLAELVIDRGSPMVHRTLKGTRFADVYQLVTIAIHRKGQVLESMPQGIDNVTLRLGDVLLVQGKREHIDEVKKRNQFLVLDATTDLPTTSKAPLSLSIMAGIILLSVFKIVPISISSIMGALLMVATNCISWRDVQRSLSAQVILIVVASLALGSALIKTGATDFLADSFLSLTSDMSPPFILSGLMLLMAILTNVVSNNAAAVIGTPIAIKIAQSLGLPPEAFVLAVLFGANMSFATPMAYKTNLLVMNAGGYTFGDFVKVGVPLSLITWLAFSFILPAMYF